MKKIRITAKHIRRGKPEDHKACPIALALKEAFNTENVSVDGTDIEVNKDFDGGFLKLSMAMSPKASKFVDAFDAGRPVKPFVLTIPGC